MTETNNEMLLAAIERGAAFAPDPDDVLRVVRTRVARRRRRRMTGTAIVAAAVVIAVFGALTVERSLGGRGHSTAQATASPAVMPVPPQRCMLRFGWLPPGLDPPSRSCGPAGEEVGYPMGAGNYLDVSMLNSSWQPTLDTPGLQQIKVGGRPAAIASRPTRTIIIFQLPSGHWVSLEYGKGYPSSSEQQATLRTDALAIANSVSEGPAEEIQVAFAPGYLPAGMRLARIYPGATPGTGSLEYNDGTGSVTKVEMGGTEDGIPVSLPVTDERYNVSISLGPPEPGLPGDSANPVGHLGNLTIYLINNNGASVVVPGFHGGVLSVFSLVKPLIEPPPPTLSTDELIKIAEHVQWFG
jgi:hypothetical protein